MDTHAEGDQVVIGVDATDVDGKFVNSTPVTGTLVTPDGKSFPIRLPQVGPGRYEIHVQAATPGAYRLTLAQPRAGRHERAARWRLCGPLLGGILPRSRWRGAAQRHRGADGRLRPRRPGEATDASGKAGTVTRYREWWGWFAVGALILFLLDLGLRLSLAPNRRRGGQPSRVRRLLTRAPPPPAPPRATAPPATEFAVRRGPHPQPLSFALGKGEGCLVRQVPWLSLAIIGNISCIALTDGVEQTDASGYRRSGHVSLVRRLWQRAGGVRYPCGRRRCVWRQRSSNLNARTRPHRSRHRRDIHPGASLGRLAHTSSSASPRAPRTASSPPTSRKKSPAPRRSPPSS